MRLPQAKPMKFRQWIICEDLKLQVIEAAESKAFPQKVFAYLSAVFGIPEEKIKKEDWISCVQLFGEASSRFPKVDTPIIKSAPKDGKPADWDYPGRNLHYYTHLLASAYGWNIEYIGDLDPSTAMALVQEVLTYKHLDEEFFYSLSEIAYPYNKSTKQSKYKPMPRPYWMLPVNPVGIKRMKIRRDMLPIGRVIDESGLPPELQIIGYETEKLK